MKIACVSDTHEQHWDVVVPKCDVLVHAGDITYRGSLRVLQDFNDWLDVQLDNEVVGSGVCIAGNHDLTLEKGYVHDSKYEEAYKIMQEGPWHYLEDSETVIDGVKFFGVPWTPRFHDWAFNDDRGPDMRAHWDKVPKDTDVLICHGPPYGVADLCRDMTCWEEEKLVHVGCADLTSFLLEGEHNIKYVVCGHIHPYHGIHDFEGVKVINASSCNPKYEPVNAPIEVEL
jgi:Icc-related predicted phosphoesterase